MKIKILLFTFIVLLSASAYPQQGNVRVGTDRSMQRQTQGAFFDYSDPEAINIKVSVWGFVKYPGYYSVPEYTTAKELLSYAGGPTDDAHLNDLRIYRESADSSYKLIKFSYDGLLWSEVSESSLKPSPLLKAGDVLSVPGEPRLYFRDTLSMTLSIISTITSVAILVISIVRK